MKTKIIYKVSTVGLLLCITAHLDAQLASYGYQQQHTYIANQGEKEIGWLRISKTENGNEKVLNSESVLFVQMLFSFDAKAQVSNRFAGNTLTSALVHRTLNGKVKLDYDFQLRDGIYKVVKGKAQKAIRKPIYNTVLSLYFSEPAGVTEVFSEVYLCFIPVEILAPSVYRTSLPDGGSMTYTYVQGVLTKVLADTNFATVVFQLK